MTATNNNSEDIVTQKCECDCSDAYWKILMLLKNYKSDNRGSEDEPANWKNGKD